MIGIESLRNSVCLPKASDFHICSKKLADMGEVQSISRKLSLWLVTKLISPDALDWPQIWKFVTLWEDKVNRANTLMTACSSSCGELSSSILHTVKPLQLQGLRAAEWRAIREVVQ
jgi:hypothetical protein